MKYKNIREEELKNKVGADWFPDFDTTEIIGNIDFTVLPKQDNLFGRIPLLWAEAKTGDFDIAAMFVQLILTIGKARTFDKTLPPAFLAAFDFKKIAFVPYINIQDIFYLNDFNWNVTPSNHDTKEFKLIQERIQTILKQNTYVYDYINDEKDLITFIKNNIANATNTSKIKIDKNNFTPIYLRWLEIIKPIIDVNWDELKKANIFDNDFYLADLFVDDRDTQTIDDDITIRDSLFVVYQNQGYTIAKENIKQMFDATIKLKNKETYIQFWKRYKRPPLKEFQDYIIERRDLLVPQDIRERKGAFFTPRQWVELSQKYLTDYLGQNWQEEYYIWDCAAGTGNLLAGLTNKYNIYASTLDQADVNVMHERIDHGANLLKNHVFQFDFLNDDFSILPQSLQNIINNEEKRKKLVIYINPPYAETSGSLKTTAKKGVNLNNVHKKYSDFLKRANHELFTQFLARVYIEIPGCIIGEFSKIKTLQGSHFLDFRNNFLAKIENIFLCQADTFDNVKGKFPIGFKIWNTHIKEKFKKFNADIYNEKAIFIGNKNLYSYDNEKGLINQWIKNYDHNSRNLKVGELSVARNDMQNKALCWISHKADRPLNITLNTLIIDCIFLTVQSSIKATWLNDRDQFLYPNDGWQEDYEFKNDCLTYALFSGQNQIKSTEGTNHWIPFTEYEVNAKEKFESHFMADFIKGKITPQQSESDLFVFREPKPNYQVPILFSDDAKEVFNAGLELWKYYHAQNEVNVNASLYDIREYFQGRNDKGRMNTKSKNPKYTELISELRNKLNLLADKLKPKIYKYEFLKE
ncbi:MAG: hypothetical protein EAZ51_08480 [Sphingobacteriales bacterium]|nr:MAG: hypothetical protein EAZ64_04340 [Sphingobacteriales bacterium]TAF78977.1 MAG: hypothetical protein EAZ51_08480 [Sphingobacteriales bacterium]